MPNGVSVQRVSVKTLADIIAVIVRLSPEHASSVVGRNIAMLTPGFHSNAIACVECVA